MFSEVELVRHVAIITKNSDNFLSERLIVTRLLQDLSAEKASKEHGYFLSITGLKSIGKWKLQEYSCGRGISVPVSFSCRTFLPVKREILQGVVHHVLWPGVFLKCGPVECVFLSARKMPNYRFVPGRNPFFEREDLTRIDVGVAVLFAVLDVRCVDRGDNRREFELLASIDGDSLGPVSLPGHYD